MHKHFRILLTALALWAGPVTVALADYQAGLDAYESGDYGAAFREFKLPADQGFASAQYNLGFMYENGQGVSQNYKEAVRWYRKAAEQGHASAQNNVGLMYKNGQGVAQDYKEAVRWYRKAAEQGDAGAQYNLGFMYDRGTGVLNDNVTAHMWYNVAGANGSKMGADNRVIIEKNMTPAQIAEAQKLAREWMEVHQ
jgi:hypothetical protein